MSKTVDINDLIGPAFKPVHARIILNRYREYWLAGGRGSLKSSFAAITGIRHVMENPDVNGIVTRKVGETMRTSVMQSLQAAIRRLGVQDRWHATNAPAQLTYLPTGQVVICKGLDDALKLKSLEIKSGYYGFLWNEEGAEYDSLEELQSVDQSVLRGGPGEDAPLLIGPKFLKIVSYNPPPEDYHWINVEARRAKPGRLVHRSNYLDVDPAWLGEAFLSDAADMARSDPVKYANVYMGEQVGNTESKVFAGRFESRAFEVERREGKSFIDGGEVDGPYYGGDFGHAADPSVLVRVWHDAARRRVYIEYESFAYGVDAELHKLKDVYEQIPGSHTHKIRADSSRPETIAFLKRQENGAFDVIGAEKGPGSVEEGIEWLKSHKTIIHERCPKALEEFRKHSYRVNKAGDVLPEFIDKFNHGIDSVRYSVEPLIKRKQGWFA